MTNQSIEHSQPVQALLERVLDRKNSADFVSPGIRAERSADGSVIKMFSTQEALNFEDMTKRRQIPAPQDWIDTLSTQSNTANVANLGVSVALTLRLLSNDEERKFAVVSYRPTQDRYMLISGYVDQKHFNPELSFAQNIRENALRELTEELIIVDGSGNTVPLEISRYNYTATKSKPFSIPKLEGEDPNMDTSLRAVPYEGIASIDTKKIHCVQISTPAYTLGLPQYAPQILIDNEQLRGNFYFDTPNSSAQFILPLQAMMVLRESEGLSFFHAEDEFNPKEKCLETKLHANGLALIELDSRGFLTPYMYHIHQGKLVQIRQLSKEVKLAEVFAPAEVPGVVTESNIMLSDYINSLFETKGKWWSR